MHVRCPHCHNPIEIVDATPLTEIACPSCGSSFSLISGETTASYIPGRRRMIGHFELIEQVGVGHFGSVWKARDTELHRTVAVKIPRSGYLEPHETELFFREARAAAQLKHPNIVAIHEVGRDDPQQTVYIVSDFIHGATPKEWLSGQRLTPREAAELCLKIAHALHHAHEAGVIHRDLKPGNIMLDLHGEPHITDFGLAKREAGEITMTVEGQILGTPAYMSPEQAKGEGHHADRRSDIYSLGVILFELLTGELPFRGETRMLIVQILKDEPPSPRKLNARIPRDLETITLKCLSKDPTRRYPTAAEVAADLQRHLLGEPIHARPISTTERCVRWCRRNPIVASLTATVAVVLILGIAISAYFAWQASNEARRYLTQKQLADAKVDEARENLYIVNIRRAATEWDAAHIDNMNAALDAARPKPGDKDLRGWEWNYLWNLAHSELFTVQGHTGYVLCVAFSPDGKRPASASWDQTVKVWDATSGAESLTLKGHTGQAYCVAFSPDGKRLASASVDQTVKVWDATSGAESLTLKGHTSFVTSVAFSPDLKRLASASYDQTVKVWDATSGAESLTLKGHTGQAYCVAFSPDGKRLASASVDQTVKVWDATSGAESLTLKGHTGMVWSVAFSPDGKRLASASEDQTVKVWDATSGAESLTLKGHTDEVTSVAFSPDGKRLASASGDQTVKVWDATSGAESLTLKGHTRVVRSVAFSPDGKRLASASEDQTVKVWDATSGAESLTLKGLARSFTSVAFSPDGKRVASAGHDRTVKLRDATSGAESLALKGHIRGVTNVAFSPDGKRLASASGDQTVKVWDATSGAELLTLKGHTALLRSVAFSSDAKRLASASDDQTVKVWDVTSGAESLTLKGHTGMVWSVAFSPDGKRLASASDGPEQRGRQLPGEVKVWDAASGAESLTLKGHTYGVSSVAFSPDGKRLASAGWDQTVKVWDATSGAELLTLKGHTDGVSSVAFSPDGKRLASASYDETVKVWDATSGAELLTLKGHSDFVSSVAFSPDGKRLASASWDQTVQVWDARPWTPELRAEREALSVIRWLQDQEKPQSEWLHTIAADQTITEPVRQRALEFAREWR